MTTLIDQNMSSTTPMVAPSPTPSPEASTPSLIVTSNSSRSNYANNVNTLQSSVSNLTNSDPSIVNYLTKNGMPSDYSSRSAMAKEYGIDNYTGSSDQNTQLLSLIQNGGKNTKSTDAPSTDTSSKKDESGTALPEDESVITDTNGVSHNVDPSIKKIYDTSLTNLDQSISQAKTDLQNALGTLQNDSSATSAVGLIMQKYDQQINAMQEKNRMLLGSYVTNGARTGMLQFANEMETNFLSEEQDKAAKRVTDLITTETNMVLKAQAAYKDGDVKAFDVASKALESATKDKTDAINKLLVESDKVVKQKQAETKQIAQQEKQKITDDIRLSTAIAQTVAESIKGSGITDKKKIQKYVSQMAEANGITNSTILESAVTKAQGQQKNEDSIINKRNSVKPATEKPYGAFKSKPTPTEISKVNSYLQSIEANQTALDDVSKDELKFYKVLNAVPKTGKSGVTPP